MTFPIPTPWQYRGGGRTSRKCAPSMKKTNSVVGAHFMLHSTAILGCVAIQVLVIILKPYSSISLVHLTLRKAGKHIVSSPSTIENEVTIGTRKTLQSVIEFRPMSLNTIWVL